MEKKGKRRYSEFLAVRIDPELLEEIERLAELEERPVGMMARILLREAVASRGKKDWFTFERRKKPGKEG